MADKFEREIEEILAKLDSDAPPAAGTSGREPISISSARKKPKPKAPKPARVSKSGPGLLDSISPTNMLFAGAGIVVAGLILSNFYGPLIWASFAGVVLFIGAFLISFRKSQRTGASGGAPAGHYWRGQQISYEPAEQSAMGRVKRFFGRK